MQGEVGHQLQHFQEAVYGGKITDETTGNISTYFYDLPTSSLRRNPYISPASGDVQIVSIPELLKRTGFRITPSTFVYPRMSSFSADVPSLTMCLAETEQISMTMYVVADFDTEAGLALVKEALTSIVRLPTPIFFSSLPV